MTFPPLNFPDFPLQIKEIENKWHVFDRIRKKWIQLTPEEWVRQHLLWYLIEFKNCSESLIQVEYGYKINNQQLRIDLAVFSKELKPIMLCECKSPYVTITNKSLSQLSLYNLTYQSPVITLTNGIKHYCLYYNKKWIFLNDIPSYDELLNLWQ